MSGYKVLLQKQFSLQVKALRHKRNLTQEEMSEHLHITSRAYSDLERGCSCPGPAVLPADAEIR